MSRDQPAQEVILRLLLAQSCQREQIGFELLADLAMARPGCTLQPDYANPLMKEGAVGVRHADQLTDHHRRQWQGKLIHQLNRGR